MAAIAGIFEVKTRQEKDAIKNSEGVRVCVRA
jgi:hypothetical protein